MSSAHCQDQEQNTPASTAPAESSDGTDHGAVCQDDRPATEQALVDRINRSDRWMICLTAAIAFSGIVNVGIFGWQLTVMKGQLTEMASARHSSDVSSADQLKAMEASRVSVEKSMTDQLAVMREQATSMRTQIAAMLADAEVRKSMLRPALKLTFNIVEARDNKNLPIWAITPQITNTGPTEARNIAEWDQLDAVPAQIIGNFDFMKIDNASFSQSPRTTLASTGIVNQITMYVTMEGARQAIAGEIILVARGYLEWNDLFQPNTTHHMRWCVQLIPLEQGNKVGFSAPAHFRSDCNQYE